MYTIYRGMQLILPSGTTSGAYQWTGFQFSSWSQTPTWLCMYLHQSLQKSTGWDIFWNQQGNKHNTLLLRRKSYNLSKNAVSPAPNDTSDPKTIKPLKTLEKHQQLETIHEHLGFRGQVPVFYVWRMLILGSHRWKVTCRDNKWCWWKYQDCCDCALQLVMFMDIITFMDLYLYYWWIYIYMIDYGYWNYG